MHCVNYYIHSGFCIKAGTAETDTNELRLFRDTVRTNLSLIFFLT
jgi:hypothetical protein